MASANMFNALNCCNYELTNVLFKRAVYDYDFNMITLLLPCTFIYSFIYF